MGDKLDKILRESKVSFEKWDKVFSSIFLYYAAICGFIFGWFSLALFLFMTGGEIPVVFVLLLRLFYFLLVFVFGIKITIILTGVIRKLLKK